MPPTETPDGGDTHFLKGFLFHERTASRIYVGICGTREAYLAHTKDEADVTCDPCRDRLGKPTSSGTAPEGD